MSGSTIGKLFKVTTFGESHGPAMGVVIDGIPSNLNFDLESLQGELDRRRPGRLKESTSRDEKDKAIVLSGIFENKTLGTPICVTIENSNQRSKDYATLKSKPRPGHADQTTLDKYGIRDHRGGGRASGRETVSRVVAGYFAQLIIPNVKVNAIITQLGPHQTGLNYDSNSSLSLGDQLLDSKISKYLLELKKTGQSCGGEVKVRVTNVPKGLGDPCFDKLKATLSHGLMSIGSCMGISFGIGESFKSALGSEISKDKSVFGGVEGGISNGDDIHLSLIFKAPSTVGDNAKEGRHDPCILPRVVPVIESMIKIVLADHSLINKALFIK